MTCYIVTFEPGNATNLERITARLKTLGQYCPINKYCWAVLTEMNAKNLRDYIGNLGGDRVFVIRSGTEAAWVNAYGNQNSEWLKKHL